MTVASPLKQAEQPQEQDQNVPGLVRCTTTKVGGLYGAVKNYSPNIKSGLETLESRIPSEWINRFTAASEPVIDLLDNQLDRVISPVQDLRNVSLSDVTGAVTSYPNAVIAATGEKVGVWKSKRGDLTKKAVVRLEKGLTVVREFSANRGKEILHIDLIAYSTEVLDNASAVARPLYEPVKQNLESAVCKLNTALAKLNTATAARSAELNEKLQTAIQAARDLSAASVVYIQQKYAQLPGEDKILTLTSNLPAPVQNAIQFLLHSPQMFVEVKSKADLATSNRMIDNFNNLLAAVKEVVFEQKPAVLIEETSDFGQEICVVEEQPKQEPEKVPNSMTEGLPQTPASWNVQSPSITEKGKKKRSNKAKRKKSSK